MKHLKVFLLLLLVAPSASAQTDSTKVQNDSITWNKELEGVTVKAQRQLIKQDIDRIGYDVQADEESKTQTVLDMLRKVPMVTVDGEDNIKVKGNSSFKIYKNGHLDPSLTQNAKEILKSMPASMVKRIEVITDPGAREDAFPNSQKHLFRSTKIAFLQKFTETSFRVSPSASDFRFCRGLFRGTFCNFVARNDSRRRLQHDVNAPNGIFPRK